MPFTKVSIKKAFTFIEPGPVLLVTTNDGHQNTVMTISWHMVLDFTPHIAVSTGSWNHSFETLMKTKECVIAIPTVDLVQKVIGIGTVSGSEIDKFEEFDLTPLPAQGVKAPLIKECLACLECKVMEKKIPKGI